MKISDPEATQVAIIPDGMSGLTFLYLDCLICLLVPILFKKKNISNEMSPSTLLYLKYFLLQFIHVPSLSKNKELRVDNKDKKHKLERGWTRNRAKN